VSMFRKAEKGPTREKAMSRKKENKQVGVGDDTLAGVPLLNQKCRGKEEYRLKPSKVRNLESIPKIKKKSKGGEKKRLFTRHNSAKTVRFGRAHEFEAGAHGLDPNPKDDQAIGKKRGLGKDRNSGRSRGHCFLRKGGKKSPLGGGAEGSFYKHRGGGGGGEKTISSGVHLNAKKRPSVELDQGFSIKRKKKKMSKTGGRRLCDRKKGRGGPEDLPYKKEGRVDKFGRKTSSARV